MGKSTVHLAVVHHRSQNSGSQNQVTLPQTLLQGWVVVAAGVRGLEIEMPDPMDHFKSPPPSTALVIFCLMTWKKTGPVATKLCQDQYGLPQL